MIKKNNLEFKKYMCHHFSTKLREVAFDIIFINLLNILKIILIILLLIKALIVDILR